MANVIKILRPQVTPFYNKLERFFWPSLMFAGKARSPHLNECDYAECFYAECEYAECRYAEYRGEYYNICEEGHKPTHLQPILILRVKARRLPL